MLSVVRGFLLQQSREDTTPATRATMALLRQARHARRRPSPEYLQRTQGLEAPMHIIWFLLFGLIVGALARFIVPGREPGGWVISMMLGVGGALVGGYFGRVVGLYEEGQPTGFIMSLLGAISLVVVYQALNSRRSRAA
jgi:uncharacterized membrane protein YeaQ/YmgE (transglycosylase-associated protein family)